PLCLCAGGHGPALEGNLRAHGDGVVLGADVYAPGRPLFHLAMNVVEHEPHVAIHIPVQTNRDVLLPPAEYDSGRIVEVDHAVARGDFPCAPGAGLPVKRAAWRDAAVGGGA